MISYKTGIKENKTIMKKKIHNIAPHSEHSELTITKEQLLYLPSSSAKIQLGL